MDQDIEPAKIIIDDLLLNYYHTDLTKLKKTLLFLHGWRSNSTLWFKIFPKLIEQNYQLYALDFPGFGQSQTPSEAFTLQDYVDVVTTFIKKLEIAHPILVGHSHGGRVGIKLASEYPDLIEKLILVDSGGIRKDVTSLNIKKSIAKIVKPVFKLPFMKGAREKIYQAMGAEDYIATPQLTQTFVNIVGVDLTPVLSSIQTKTLLIWGENDKDTPPQDAKIINDGITHSKLEIIKDAGHYSFLDQPEEFTNHLLKFIQ